MKVQSIYVLGSTGSIGESTLDVIARHPDRFQVYALSAYSRIDKLASQAVASRSKVLGLTVDAADQHFGNTSRTDKLSPEVRVGASALAATATDPEVSTVMAAIVGTAGLPSALAAAQ